MGRHRSSAFHGIHFRNAPSRPSGPVFSLVLLLSCAVACSGCDRSESTRPTADNHQHGDQLALSMGRDLPPDHGLSHTFSIVAADPESGICGAAVASLYPKVGEVVPYVKAGVGAFCTQHYHHPAFGPKALQLLAEEKTPEAVLAEILAGDDRPEQRQLAIIDRHGRVANHNPTQAGTGSRWWGAMSGRYYSCQGNTLTGSQVVISMAKAYETTKGSVADRLLAALVAGDRAGGDHRGRLAAGMVVAKPGVEGDWLNLQVDGSDDAVNELAKKYVALDHAALGDWAKAHNPWPLLPAEPSNPPQTKPTPAE